MMNIIKTAATASIIAATVFTASAKAQDAIHAQPIGIDLTQEISIANASFEEKLFDIVLDKAEATITLDLAKIENNPQTLRVEDMFADAAF